MKKTQIVLLIALVIIIGGACGLMQEPAPQPGLSATDFPPSPTALAKLPSTWTPSPTLIPIPTKPPTPTYLPIQHPNEIRIDLYLGAIMVRYPQEFVNRGSWNTVQGETATIRVPANYEVVDYPDVIPELSFGLMDALTDVNKDLAGIQVDDFGTEILEGFDPDEIPGVDFIIARDESTSTTIILASVNRSAETTSEDLINEALSGGEIDFLVESRLLYLDSPLAMERVILTAENEYLGEVKQIVYAILGEKHGWNLVFITPDNLIKSNLPVFESVVDSLSPIQ